MAIFICIIIIIYNLQSVYFVLSSIIVKVNTGIGIFIISVYKVAVFNQYYYSDGNIILAGSTSTSNIILTNTTLDANIIPFVNVISTIVIPAVVASTINIISTSNIVPISNFNRPVFTPLIVISTSNIISTNNIIQMILTNVSKT